MAAEIAAAACAEISAGGSFSAQTRAIAAVTVKEDKHREASFHKNMEPYLLPGLRPFVMRLPLKDRKGRSFVRGVKVLLPHETFWSVAGHKSELLTGDNPGFLQTFWDSVRSDDWAANHPVYSSGVDFNLACPLLFHGDDGTTYKHGEQSHLALSFTSAVTVGKVFSTRFLITCINARSMTTAAFWELQRMMKWSLNCLMTGIWHGAPFCEGKGLCFSRFLF
jgi:hypothetical protein